MPNRSSLRIVPTGASEDVAVTISTDVLSAHSDDKASPLNPNDVTASRSLNELSFDVWCLRPAYVNQGL